MIPIRDTEPSRTKPVLIKIIILINAAVFLYELSLGPRLQSFTMEMGLVPARYFGLAAYGPEAWFERFSPLITHMFLHGGWAHVIFNMLFLWVFGDNIEDRLGRIRFAAFYLVCGLAAAYLQLYLSAGSLMPMIGASGAIAGVMGGYMVLFPRARVIAIVPIFFFIQLVQLPAVIFLGFWFVVQFLSGTVTTLEGARQTGGVAFWAHTGGFAAGVALVKVLAKPVTTGYGIQSGRGGPQDGTSSDATAGDEPWKL
jgi:hypothetical protein